MIILWVFFLNNVFFIFSILFSFLLFFVIFVIFIFIFFFDWQQWATIEVLVVTSTRCFLSKVWMGYARRTLKVSMLEGRDFFMYWFLGTPSKLNVTCKLFETSNGKEIVIKLFSRASITQHILCSITDTFGNQTHVKTPIAIEWVPSSAGNSFEKRTNQKGEIIFQANSIKCYADKGTVTMKICPTDMKNIEVSTNFVSGPKHRKK